MQIGSDAQPSQTFYNQGYQDLISAYKYYKNWMVLEDKHYVSYDAWRHRYGCVLFDY